MEGRFSGKVALVTGAASGIGRATAIAFAREGARTVLADVDAERGEEAAAAIRAEGGEAVFQQTDVSSPEGVRRLIARCVEEYGGLDCAFNNAGIEGQLATTVECTEENWDRTIDVNLKGVWLCMREEIPVMERRGGGAIVNCASVAGLVGFRNLPAYSASKGAIIELTRTTALECAEIGIRVDSVCPGVIRTPMVDRVVGGDPGVEAQFTALEPMGRMGEPEEIADSVLWLCSDGASFVTGHALVADGGLVAQ